MVKAPILKDPDFISEQGIKVWTYGLPITKDQFDIAANIFVVGLGMHGIDYSVTFSAIEKIEVEWTTERIRISGIPDGASGVKIGQHIIVQWPGKISTSALYHEWFHAVLFLLVRTSDPDHTSLWWNSLIPDIQRLAEAEGI
jgi:hypothetical protein